MLYEFLEANQVELIARCRAKVARRRGPPLSANVEPSEGIPVFLGQLVATLRREHETAARAVSDDVTETGSSAGRHGGDLLRLGLNVDQVVHEYGDLCQAVTELAHETKAQITVDEFRTLNRSLDNAIADAVTEFARQRDQAIAMEGAQTANERLGNLAHELRNLLNSAILAYRAVESGSVALTGATGKVLGRSLIGLREVIDRSLADVRLSEGLSVRKARIVVAELIAEVQVGAAMDAHTKGVRFTTSHVDEGLVVEGDWQLLSAAIANLLQNAFKFTRPHSHVALSARAEAGRVLIDVADECGGLPQGDPENLFASFSQRGSDRSGLGLGLSISRRSVEASGGRISVRNQPGTGCVFIIDLPQR